MSGTAPTPRVILTGAELEEIAAAYADPEYVRRLAADARAASMVEVDNPMRREIRPRRGTER